jgi:hypothetical protein
MSERHGRPPSCCSAIIFGSISRLERRGKKAKKARAQWVKRAATKNVMRAF